MDHPTPTGRMGNEVAIFFEGALLPSTGAGRARVSFRTAHLVKRRATPADQGFSQACRGKAKSLASTSQGCHSTKTRKPHTKGSRDTSFPTRGQPQASRTGTGYGGGARGNRNPGWGASPTLPSKLAEDLKRSLDTEHRKRGKGGVSQHAHTTEQAKRNRDRRSTVAGNHRGSARIGKETRHRPCTKRRGVFQHNISGAKVRRRLATGNKPQVSQQACYDSPFQDGIDKDREGPHATGGLVTQVGLERCLSLGSDVQSTPEISEVPVARPILAISSSTIWAEQCTTDVYEAHETCDSTPKEDGDKVDHVSRRHAYSGKNEIGGKAAASCNPEATGSLGLYHQPEEEYPYSNSEGRIPGISTELPQDGDFPTGKQTSCTQETGKEDDENTENQNPGPGEDFGNNGGSTPSHSSCPDQLQAPGKGKNTGSEKRPQLRIDCRDHSRHEDRASVVDRRIIRAQRSTFTSHSMGHDHRVRCIEDGLGCMLPGDFYGRTLDASGEGTQYQLPGAPGSLSRIEIICDSPEYNFSAPEVGQHICNSFHQQDGRYPLTVAVKPRSGDMEVVPGKGCGDPRGTCPRCREHQSRLGIQACERLWGLDARPTDLPTTESAVRTILNRPLRLEDERTTSALLQLETGPGGMGRGCLHRSMEMPIPIYVSTIHTNTPMLEQTENRTGIGSDDSASLAQPGLVSSITEPARGLPNSTPPNRGYSHKPRRQQPSTGDEGQPPSGRLARLRRSYNSAGLSDKVIDIIRRSWRSSTESAYSSAWRQWERWCIERGCDPVSAPVGDILEFLLGQYEAGKRYRTINSLRSAISMTHNEIDGVRIGQHALVCRFLKGVYNCRPPRPKYSSTWEVDIVLDYTRTLQDNDRLPFQQLTHKLATLMALANADRCSDLAALDLSYHSAQGNGVLFTIPGLTKSRRKGPPLQAFYTSFPEEPLLCPVRALNSYIKRSENLRYLSTADNRLFISVRKPHKPVKPATIGHWIKGYLKGAGIDTQTFSAHSTRGASTSKAKAMGVSCPRQIY